MIWTPYDWLNKGYSFYMAAVIVSGSWHGLRIEVHSKSKLSLYMSCYFHLNILFIHSTQATRWTASVIKVVVACVGKICVFKRRADLGLLKTVTVLKN